MTHGFDTWDDLDHALRDDDWQGVHVMSDRSMRVYGNVEGWLGLYSDELSPKERAQLCRFGFIEVPTPEGPVWCWASPASRRRLRWGPDQTPRNIGIARILQQGRKLIRVLRDVLAPSRVTCACGGTTIPTPRTSTS